MTTQERLEKCAADKARKSIGYTSLGGSYWANGNDDKAYLCIFEFATGKELKVFDKCVVMEMHEKI